MNIRLYEMKVSGLGPFRETQIVKFDGDTSFVYAPNGHGKTSLIDLIRWCLAGEEAIPEFRSIDPKALLNKERFNQQQPSGFVELVLTVVDNSGQERLKRIKRSIKYERMAPEEEFTVSAWDNEKATFRKEDNPLIRLRELFPPERLNLNLMTGEHMKEFTTSIDNRQLRRQIESLLQFPELKTTRDILDAVRGHLNDQARKVKQKGARQEKAARELDQARATVSSCDKRVEKLTGDIDHTREAIEEQIERLNRLSGGRDVEQQRTVAKETLDNALESLERKEEELGKAFSGFWRRLATYGVSGQAEEILRTHEKYEEQMNRYQQSLGQVGQLQDLLKKDHCVCLRPIDGNATRGIKNEIDRLKSMAPVEPETHGFTKWTLESWANKNDFTTALEKVKTKTNELNRLQLDVQKAKRRLREIEEVLSDDIGAKYKEAKRKKDELWEEREKLISRKKEIENEREEALARIKSLEKRLGVSKGSEDAVHSLASMADRYYQAFAEVVEKVVPYYKGKLLEEVQTTFRALYSKNRKASVRLNDNFIPYVLEPSEEGVAKTNVRLSEGEALRLGLALLISIRRVAHERPFLVIDAPFSDLDETGVEDLLKVIEEDPSQIIILCKERFTGHHAEIIDRMGPTVFQMDWHLNRGPGSKAQGHTKITPSTTDVLKSETSEQKKVIADG